jgi:D-aminopeptidase
LYLSGLPNTRTSKTTGFAQQNKRYERGREFSTQPAAAIVEAARQFGQQDDITVVTIERDLAIASAA